MQGIKKKKNKKKKKKMQTYLKMLVKLFMITCLCSNKMGHFLKNSLPPLTVKLFEGDRRRHRPPTTCP